MDRFFRLVSNLGFPIAGAGGYFGGTAFPVEVDNRGTDLDIPFNDRTPEDRKACRDRARQLLDCLNLPGGKVKRVRVRKVAIDVEMESDDEDCDST